MTDENKYILTGTRGGFFRDKLTFWRVPANKVLKGCWHFAENNIPVVFIYKHDGAVGSNTYVGSYSAKYKNFKIDGKYIRESDVNF